VGDFDAAMGDINGDVDHPPGPVWGQAHAYQLSSVVPSGSSDVGGDDVRRMPVRRSPGAVIAHGCAQPFQVRGTVRSGLARAAKSPPANKPPSVLDARNL
jgi:hypothetical protein